MNDYTHLIAQQRLNDVPGLDHLEEKVPGDPYDRAVHRIEALYDRFDGDERRVEQHTLARLYKITRPAKVEGLYLAAKDFGLSKVVREARRMYKEMTGMNPRRV